MEQAKGDAKATAAEVATITALLDSLENQTGMLGTTAVAAGADYVLTQSKLDAATAEVARLNAHTRQAADAAAKCEKQAVAVAVQSYKSGGAGANLFAAVVMLSSQENLDGADFLMHQVGE